VGLCCHLGKGRLKLGRFNGEIFYTLREAQIVSTPQSDTSHQHQRCSCPHSPPGRLRYADRLRRGSYTAYFEISHIGGKFHRARALTPYQVIPTIALK